MAGGHVPRGRTQTDAIVNIAPVSQGDAFRNVCPPPPQGEGSGVRGPTSYSNISTVRATSPSFIARKASFTSSSLARFVIISSSFSLPCR